MRLVFVIRRSLPEGGVSLATFRLAASLRERGHEAMVVYSQGEPPAGLESLARPLGGGADDAISPGRLRRELEALDPGLVLVGSGSAADLRAARAAAPTLLHAHMHNGVCADNSRYWARLRRPCAVRAGWHCAVLRPALGCSGFGRALDAGHVAAQRRLLAELRGGELGVLCVSTDQARLFAAHGVSGDRTAVLPNLGIRASAAELAAASAATPADRRDATAFFGRLSKAKGGQLLAGLGAALPAGARFRVFGDGYLAGRLAALPGAARGGHLSQPAVSGVLMWARATVFPSLWPEPGGIVGIDAQVMGVPLAAFDVGAARAWPAAERFRLGDVRAMAAWLATLEPRRRPRDPEAVAGAQAAYWQRVAVRGEKALAAFAAAGRFPPPAGAPAEELIA